MNQLHKQPVNNLTEGLRRSDLKDTIEPLFTIDQYQSKMGEDRDVLVLRFRAADKEPAIDLMEFIEKGYPFVLDADISSGEERDGKYSIFVEMERTKKAPGQIKDLLNGISQLCDCTDWRFRFYKDMEGYDFSEDAIRECVPLTPEDYEVERIAKQTSDVSDFFDQGALDSVEVGEGRQITFHKPYSESLTATLIALGDYELLKEALKGAIQLDETSHKQITYLNKYLGNYDIHKIENHFLIRNGDQAVIIAKDTW